MTTAFQGGIPFSEVGALQTISRPQSGVPSTEPVNGGWAVSASLESAYVEAAGTAVPATAVLNGGLAFTPDGALYVTESTTGTFSNIGGHKVRSDGALLVKVGTPTPGTDPYLGGWAHDGAARGAYVGGNGASFVLQFKDLGAGVVDTTPTIGGVAATFTRATSAWTNLSDGTIGLVASGSPRSYYSPSGTYLGYLAEGARTNLCQRGEDFSTVWAAVGTPTLSAGSTTLGALSLSTVGDDSAAALEGYSQAISFTGNAVKAISIYVKKGTSTSSQIKLLDNTATANRLNAVITWSGTVPVVTMTTGTDLTGTPVQQGATGVYRLSFATTSVTAANSNLLQIYPATDSASSVGGTGTIEVGGVQAEDATFPSTLIRTPASATVTRNADVLTYPTTGISGTVGTWFANVFIPVGDASTNAYVWNLNSAGNAPPMYRRGTGGTLALFDGTSERAGPAWTAGASVKIASAYSGSTASLVLNGGAISEVVFDGDFGVGTNMGVVSAAGVANLFGTISSPRYWSRRLTNAELQRVST